MYKIKIRDADTGLFNKDEKVAELELTLDDDIGDRSYFKICKEMKGHCHEHKGFDHEALEIKITVVRKCKEVIDLKDELECGLSCKADDDSCRFGLLK